MLWEPDAVGHERDHGLDEKVWESDALGHEQYHGLDIHALVTACSRNTNARHPPAPSGREA